jgi:hypothetical protein
MDTNRICYQTNIEQSKILLDMSLDQLLFKPLWFIIQTFGFQKILQT